MYEFLKENVTEPGRYVINPEITPERRFPEGQPVFGLFYSGIGHESAGGLISQYGEKSVHAAAARISY